MAAKAMNRLKEKLIAFVRAVADRSFKPVTSDNCDHRTQRYAGQYACCMCCSLASNKKLNKLWLCTTAG